MTAPTSSTIPPVTRDDFPLEAVDHLRFAVGNAKQAAH